MIDRFAHSVAGFADYRSQDRHACRMMDHAACLYIYVATYVRISGPTYVIADPRLSITS